MPDWKREALKALEESVFDGEHPDDVAHDLVAKYLPEIKLAAEMGLLDTFKKSQKKRWAEPSPDMEQLRFNLNGLEVAISDAPVRYVDEDGEERFKSARHSTGAERVDSLAARYQHHLSWMRRSEAEQRREEEQNAALMTLGIDVMGQTWDAIRHHETICWRCEQGYRAGDPFEQGHCDKPASQGGSQTAWEHRSCNRESSDNPVAHPPSDAEDEAPF